MLRKPTLQERKFAKILIKTGRKSLATRGAYHAGSHGGKVTPESINRWGDNLLRQRGVQQAIREELDRVGLGDDVISERLHSIVYAGTDEGKLKFTDVKTALDAIKEVNKMKGNYAAEKKEVRTQSMKIGIDLSGKNSEDMMQILNDTSKQIQEFQKVVEATKKINKERPPEKGEIL